MKAGDCVNLIFPRVLSSNNEVSVRFSQVILTRRGSQAGCWAHSIHLGYQGSQIKLKGWVVVSKNPWLLKVNTFKAPADLSCSAWHPTDTNPLSSHLLGKCPGYPRVCRCFSHWICSPLHCRSASCQVSLELARQPFMICLLTDPSRPVSLCRLHQAYPSSGDVGWAPGSLNPTSTNWTHQELFASK